LVGSDLRVAPGKEMNPTVAVFGPPMLEITTGSRQRVLILLRGRSGLGLMDGVGNDEIGVGRDGSAVGVLEAEFGPESMQPAARRTRNAAAKAFISGADASHTN
jgi:hypothetical protein